MLLGTPFGGDYPGDGFTRACLERMDSSPAFPVPGAPSLPQQHATMLAVVAEMTAASAWVALLAATMTPGRARRLALTTVLPSAVMVLVNLRIVIAPVTNISDWIALPTLCVEIAAVIAFIMIMAHTHLSTMDGVRATFALWGVTAFGVMHLYTEYMLVATVNQANWDSPPGTGYLTAVALLVSGVVSLTGSRTPTRVARLADQQTAVPTHAALL